YAVCLKDTPTKFAVKKFTNDYPEEIIINEIRLMKIVDYHPNIIGFCGVTKFEEEKNYSLILEYANGGTLGKYLRENVKTFKSEWERQLKFARDIARSNFYTKGSRGVIPYMDPKFFENHSYDLTEKSDIYSFGVLCWELTSCSSPFNFETTVDTAIQVKILEGVREKPISTTNGKFVYLYQKCWQHEPDERPNIYQVISELNSVTDSNSEESVRTEETENDEKADHFFDCDITRY
ncbi:13492_t:CDS:2, partial [Funneliformis caledonium]